MRMSFLQNLEPTKELFVTRRRRPSRPTDEQSTSAMLDGPETAATKSIGSEQSLRPKESKSTSFS
jgi:hypothetical protein